MGMTGMTCLYLLDSLGLSNRSAGMLTIITMRWLFTTRGYQPWGIVFKKNTRFTTYQEHPRFAEPLNL